MDQAISLAVRALRASRRPDAARTLLLDLDGTLAPLAPRPELAEVPLRTLDALRRLSAARWRIGVVSGRPAASVRGLLPVRNVRIFGSHAAEGSWKPGSRRPAVAAGLRRRLDELARSATALAAGTPGAWVERKPTGLALHDRNVPVSRLKEWRRKRSLWLAARPLDGLETLDGKRILELRPAGAHKGRAVAGLRLPSRFDASLIAMGDDRTDEDLFRAVGPRGMTVRVGRAGVRTAARYRLASPAGVSRFLTRLARG